MFVVGTFFLLSHTNIWRVKFVLFCRNLSQFIAVLYRDMIVIESYLSWESDLIKEADLKLDSHVQRQKKVQMRCCLEQQFWWWAEEFGVFLAEPPFFSFHFSSHGSSRLWRGSLKTLDSHALFLFTCTWTLYLPRHEGACPQPTQERYFASSEEMLSIYFYNFYWLMPCFLFRCET